MYDSCTILVTGDDYIREIQHSHNITIVPMLSSEPGKDEQAEDMVRTCMQQLNISVLPTFELPERR